MNPMKLTVEYDNDVGPEDEGFWEWWEVDGVKFGSEMDAKEYLTFIQAKFIMDKRGWSVQSEWSNHGEFVVTGWNVIDENGGKLKQHYVSYHDPFIAIVEANKWYETYVEKSHESS